MLNKLAGKPIWYRIWAITVALAAIYLVARLLLEPPLSRFDYAMMFYTHVSILLDMWLYPRGKRAGAQEGAS
jgi:hypothetical protein